MRKRYSSHVMCVGASTPIPRSSGGDSIMMVLVSYDVSTRDDAGRRRLRRVARLCEDHGQRVQNSVFECVVDSAQWVVLRASLLSEADPAQDSLRFYFLGTEWRRRVEHVGAKLSYDPEAPLIL
jgi:CRISPR-associated protein Cas2